MDRRVDIYDYTPEQRAELAELMLRYLDEDVIRGHAAISHEEPYPFLQGHREYLAGLQAFLVQDGFYERHGLPEVLPKWDPSTPVPDEFWNVYVQDPSYAPAYDAAVQDLVYSQAVRDVFFETAVEVGAIETLPETEDVAGVMSALTVRQLWEILYSARFEDAFSRDEGMMQGMMALRGALDNYRTPMVSSVNEENIIPDPFALKDASGAVARDAKGAVMLDDQAIGALPSPAYLYAEINGWHGSIHTSIGGMMGTLDAPAAPLFWIWHAYVDDLYQINQTAWNARVEQEVESEYRPELGTEEEFRALIVQRDYIYDLPTLWYASPENADEVEAYGKNLLLGLNTLHGYHFTNVEMDLEGSAYPIYDLVSFVYDQAIEQGMDYAEISALLTLVQDTRIAMLFDLYEPERGSAESYVTVRAIAEEYADFINEPDMFPLLILTPEKMQVIEHVVRDVGGETLSEEALDELILLLQRSGYVDTFVESLIEETKLPYEVIVELSSEMGKQLDFPELTSLQGASRIVPADILSSVNREGIFFDPDHRTGDASIVAPPAFMQWAKDALVLG